MIQRNKTGRRIRRGIFLLAMLVAVCFGAMHAGAAGSQTICTTKAKKVTLSKTSISTVVGRTTMLRLKNAKGRIVWKSSKPSVAGVSKSGKITAKKTGTCKITAKYRGKSYRCTVKVYRSSVAYRPALLKKTYAPGRNTKKILLAGSSSVEFWNSADSAFAPYKILNMGVANSKVAHWQKWYSSMIVPYKPSAVVLYIGSNDIGDGLNGLTGSQTAAQTRSLIQKIQKKLPKTPIYYVSICPSPKRFEAWGEIWRCNKKMRAYCSTKKNLYYVDVASFFWEDGEPDATLFRDDLLHLNRDGYDIWEEVICPKVKARLKKR